MCGVDVIVQSLKMHMVAFLGVLYARHEWPNLEAVTAAVACIIVRQLKASPRGPGLCCLHIMGCNSRTSVIYTGIGTDDI